MLNIGGSSIGQTNLLEDLVGFERNELMAEKD